MVLHHYWRKIIIVYECTSHSIRHENHEIIYNLEVKIFEGYLIKIIYCI